MVETSMLSSSFFASSPSSTEVLPFLTTCFGPRTAAAGLGPANLADDQPVEQHADRRQVLLDGRTAEIGRDVMRAAPLRAAGHAWRPPMHRVDAWRMVQRRAAALGVRFRLGC